MTSQDKTTHHKYPYGILAGYAIQNHVGEAANCLRELPPDKRSAYFHKLAEDIEEQDLGIDKEFFQNLQLTCYYKRHNQDPREHHLECSDEECMALVGVMLKYGLAEECLQMLASQTCDNVTPSLKTQLSDKVKNELDRQKKEGNHSSSEST